MQVQVVQGRDGFVVAEGPAQYLQGPVGQHLVDVHVRARAGSALEGIDNHVGVQQPLGHLAAGRLNCGGLGIVPPAQLMIGPGAGEFHRPIGPDQRRLDRPAGQGEVLDSPGCVDAVQRIGRHSQRA